MKIMVDKMSSLPLTLVRSTFHILPGLLGGFKQERGPYSLFFNER